MQIVSGTDVQATVLDVVAGARRQIVIAVPFLHAWRRLRLALEDAVLGRRVQMTVLLKGGASAARENESTARWLEELGASVALYEPLHAKIVLSERTGIVGSLNLNPGSALSSWDAGVVFSARADRKAYQELQRHLGSALRAAGSESWRYEPTS